MTNSTASRPSRAANIGVRLNRKHGIFQLVHRETFRLMIIIAPSAEVARVQAMDAGKIKRRNPLTRQMELLDDGKVWGTADVDVDCIGLAEASQPLGLVAKSGEW